MWQGSLKWHMLLTYQLDLKKYLFYLAVLYLFDSTAAKKENNNKYTQAHVKFK